MGIRRYATFRNFQQGSWCTSVEYFSRYLPKFLVEPQQKPVTWWILDGKLRIVDFGATFCDFRNNCFEMSPSFRTYYESFRLPQMKADTAYWQPKYCCISATLFSYSSTFFRRSVVHVWRDWWQIIGEIIIERLVEIFL